MRSSRCSTCTLAPAHARRLGQPCTTDAHHSAHHSSVCAVGATDRARPLLQVDTTAHTSTWLLYMLIQHPQVERKLLDELDGLELLATPQRPEPRLVTSADVFKLPYLQAVIKAGPLAPLACCWQRLAPASSTLSSQHAGRPSVLQHPDTQLQRSRAAGALLQQRPPAQTRANAAAGFGACLLQGPTASPAACTAAGSLSARPVQEVLRIYPPVGIGQLRCNYKSDIVLGGQLHIPRGTILWVPHHALHTAKHNWEDPDAFMPGRVPCMHLAGRVRGVQHSRLGRGACCAGPDSSCLSYALSYACLPHACHQCCLSKVSLQPKSSQRPGRRTQRRVLGQ